MHFLRFFGRKYPKTLTRRDATCVRCPISFIAFLGAYIGHAHTLAKNSFISCMRSRPLVQPVPFRCAGRATLKDVFFFTSTERSPTFSTYSRHHREHARQFSLFSDVLCIFYRFSGENTLKHCPNVTRRAVGVRFRSYPSWGPTLGMHTPSQKIVSFHACDHAPLVQLAPFRCAGRATLKGVFFSPRRNDPQLFPRTPGIIGSMHDNFHYFLTSDAFSTVFPVKIP